MTKISQSFNIYIKFIWRNVIRCSDVRTPHHWTLLWLVVSLTVFTCPLGVCCVAKACLYEFFINKDIYFSNFFGYLEFFSRVCDWNSVRARCRRNVNSNTYGHCCYIMCLVSDIKCECTAPKTVDILRWYKFYGCYT